MNIDESRGDGISGIGLQIERLTKNAAKSSILEAKGNEPPGYYYLQSATGDAKLTLANAPWHTEALASPNEMLGFIQRQQSADKLKDPAIFYDEGNVTLVYDAADRRDVAVCKLVPSEQYAALLKIGGTHMPQREMVRMLRIMFRNCLADTRLLTLMRDIKWSMSGDGESKIDNGKESMGRKIVSSVQGVDALPEELSLTIPVFDNHPFRTTITCAIDISTQNCTFAIVPYPQELHNAMELALDDILFCFSSDGLPPAFRGSPSKVF